MGGGDGCSADAQEKTSDFYETHNLPARFECPGLQNYSKTRRTPTNPFYATTYNDYGYFPPTVHTVRKCYHGKPQRFGQEQFVRGMYRDNSLNM
ncbi:piercer of microtubule wall 2 protein-like [Metopolophium dirhodum]|uniref:piercer of microtubule wall 2 protein-like n=1 Tax=Metopolophium dirhodum TaxID=44670 RepID=UPI00299033A1|nr:piercer of microtubule wall 2 protein-like [Metopolophium dirhodum]